MRFRLLIGVALFSLLLTACGGGQNPTTAKKLRVVTTIPPLYSLAANIVDGVDVELTNIVPPNASVHTFQLKPSIAQNIASADIIVMNGVELEQFLEKTLTSSKAKVVDTSKGVALSPFKEESHDDHHDEHEDDHEEHGHNEEHKDEHHDEHGHDDHHDDEHGHHGHDHGEFDPHIWLSPDNAKIQAKNILDALVAADKDNAVLYQKNYENLVKKLDTVSKDLRQKFAALTVTPYIVFHDAYHYFEKHFGVEAVAFLQEFPGKEPSASYLANVIDIIKDNNVRVMFAEPQFSPKLIKTIASDYDVKVGTLDPLGTEVSKDGYFSLLQKNYDAFAEFFAPQS